MSPLRYSPFVALAAAFLWQPGWAVETPPTPAPPAAAPSVNSLLFSANGSTLTGASGGGGGSIGWLHDFSNGVLGLAGEYQTLADAHWAFGSLTGAVSTGSANVKWTFSGDAHLGSGDIAVSQGLHRFNYDVEGADVAGTFGGKLTLQLDAQQYDIDTTHGTLPKAGLGYLWSPHWQTTFSYARSVTGNLGTELETARLDHYGSTVSWLVGAATGHVAPAVVNLYTGIYEPAPQLREGYLGFSKSFAGSDWSILGDYMKVANEKRITLTVVCTLHVGRSAT